MSQVKIHTAGGALVQTLGGVRAGGVAVIYVATSLARSTRKHNERADEPIRGGGRS